MSGSYTRAGLVLILWANLVPAAEPQSPEPPPITLEIKPTPILPAPFIIYDRPSAYDVWQNYGVDRYGRFRPRVIYSPFGPYYYRDGKPYPWSSNHSLSRMPQMVN